MTEENQEYIYYFGEGPMDKQLLGGKGANLGEMARIGLPVPPGFSISTEMCSYYTENGKYPEGFFKKVKKNLERVEEDTDKGFGDPENPLLVSVRSGAAVSMPGMMDTVLNLGLNDETVEGLAEISDSDRFAYDSYRRLIQMFGDVVLGMDHGKFEDILEDVKQEKGVEKDTELETEDLKEVIKRYKKLMKEESGQEFPQDPDKQLRMSITAVFESWDNERAIKYREAHDIPHDMGTAVNVQTMVFGNLGTNSATGVGFTRNPSDGKKELYGEYLKNAQGEDVVAGIRTPKSLQELEEDMPDVYDELKEIQSKLENHYKDVQDFEFTVEDGKLWLLQTRTGKRTSEAEVKIAVDMAEEGIIDKETAIERVDPESVEKLLHKRIDPEADKEVISEGLNASPGAASGKVVFNPDEAESRSEEGEKVVLVRPETSPEDIHGLMASQGIVTTRGGMTSHAAVVARGMGKPCVAGADEISIDLESKEFKVDGETYGPGDTVTIDGSEGEVIKGSVPMVEPKISGSLDKLLSWSDEIRNLGVRTNADTPEDAKKAREFGAEGIGLCRTEHMFMESDRIPIMREMILAESDSEREEALNKLLPMQKGDFKGIFKEMDTLPVIIRLLDPPLHEFLPDSEDLIEEITEESMRNQDATEEEEMLEKLKGMEEANPMLGLRGCRLGIKNPAIFEMQAKAITRAAVEAQEEGVDVEPYIMIPLVSMEQELKVLREKVEQVVESELEEAGVELDYKIGTMIELPRACVNADKIAEHADFFSFGTNDLTQTTFGFSRDDAEGKFFGPYMDQGIMEDDPFQTLDQTGVGKLMETAVDLAKDADSSISLGICGEHGGDPESISFSREVGLDYVSCSPYRVPIARLAAAKAVLNSEEEQ